MKEFFDKTKSPLIFPRPVTLVTSHSGEGDNIITLSWVGTVCSVPPVVGIGIRKSRFSYSHIEKSGEFVVNIPGADLIREADFCGTRSGRDIDKFKKTGLTKEHAKLVNAPLIKECPINIECKLIKTVIFGSHTLFLGEVVGTHIDEKILREGKFDDEKFQPLAYLSPHYFTVKKIEGEYGFTKDS
ncbi:MAG: flavin reductase family protein [Candidatus Cloacimonadota bacterium]|nr:MAG: flavin reductase family protein [Candidatus Cloacimonadota bacterium]